METKKISFGFMKTKKAEKPHVEEKKEFIECVEEKAIKVVGGEVIEEKAPLVIPMKPNTLITAEKLKKIAEEMESAIDEPEKDNKPKSLAKEIPENETLDQMAVRELLEDAKKETKVDGPILTVPLPAIPIMDGEKESTLDDYESVPIAEFGMAMLRGMGWKPNKDQSKYKQPQLRPKGLGLGADKVIADSQKKKSSKDKEEELSIVKNSYVKITTGKNSGYYGKVVSLDEDNGRVMIDITIKKETVSLSEFMVQPVTKSEFDKESKVINADSFEEYKKNEKLDKSSKHDSSRANEKEASSSKKSNDLNKEYDKRESKNKEDYRTRDYENSSNGRSRDRHRRDSSDSEERYRRRKKKEKKYSSSDSLNSLSDSEKRRRHKSKNRRKSTDSDSSPVRDKRKKTPEGKRDIDKKRKGKKKKRDRDRSPNYKKYRK
ncbi:G-patch domain and KOW motifs-containing protein [Galleria mellonella]|uniref:G-patch domain and KOW motifs-containing protein n=1 Tax=Galleria mellonella TaxID=7137 RepID=A0A6J1W9S2_GALME|nr:G-patch domain and KOW motifs-containing protein [Galleria mellonella]